MNHYKMLRTFLLIGKTYIPYFLMTKVDFKDY